MAISRKDSSGPLERWRGSEGARRAIELCFTGSIFAPQFLFSPLAASLLSEAQRLSWTATAGEVIIRELHSERKRWLERGSLGRELGARVFSDAERRVALELRKKWFRFSLVRGQGKKSTFLNKGSFLCYFCSIFRNRFFLYTTQERARSRIRYDLYKTAEQ